MTDTDTDDGTEGPVEPPSGDRFVTTTEFAAFADYTATYIRQLQRAESLPRGPRGMIPFVAGVRALIRFLRDSERRSSRTAADGRVRDARAHDLEVRTAERLGVLVPIEAFDAMIDDIVGAFRSELSGLPARITRDITLRRNIEREIYGLLERVTGLCTDHSERMAKGRDAYKAVKDHKPVPVGDQQSNVSNVGGNTRTS
jgi:hypothetical protein